MTSEDTEVDEARSGSKDFQCSTAQITSGLYALRPAGTVKRNRRCSGTGPEGEKSREDRGNRLIIQTASLSPSFTVHYHPRQPQAPEREAGR